MEILLESTSNKVMVGIRRDLVMLEILSRRLFLKLNLSDHRDATQVHTWISACSLPPTLCYRIASLMDILNYISNSNMLRVKQQNADGQSIPASTVIPQPFLMTHAPFEEDVNMSFHADFIVLKFLAFRFVNEKVTVGGYRWVKVLEFFDCPGLRQGVENLRELLPKEGMPILRGWKSVPRMNSSEREMERGYYSAFTRAT
nr:golgin candidate 6 [Tanacetum cinerariifolium]